MSVTVSPNDIKNDIFKIYTERAVENVQDGISRTLGSREITKSRGEGFFLLTLYLSRFHQIIKTWVFLKSTRKGLLKNDQDGIF